MIRAKFYSSLLLLCSVAPASLLAMTLFRSNVHSICEQAFQKGFEQEYFDTSHFQIMTLHRLNRSSSTIRIYIEGDGRSWQTRSEISDDPTPSEPVALELAIEDPSLSIAYLARPGQYPRPNAALCDSAFWSSRRFAPEVVDSLNQIIDQLKERSGAQHLEIAGYSGGGALAVLIASRRSDVSAIRTIAGNLDPHALHAYHKVSQLEGSLNPLDIAEKVSSIPQLHFVGSRDRIVPPFVTKSFFDRARNLSSDCIVIIDATHHDGWRKCWPALLSIPLSEKQ